MISEPAWTISRLHYSHTDTFTVRGCSCIGLCLNVPTVQSDVVFAWVNMCGHVREQWGYWSAHTCASLTVWDGWRCDGLPNNHPSISTPPLLPSIHHSFIHHSLLFSSLSQKQCLCQSHCRAHSLKARWTEVDLHYSPGYEKTWKGNTAHLELMVLEDRRVETAEFSIFTAHLFSSSDPRKLRILLLNVTD